MDKCDERRQLSVEQERALELIILGQNDREVAESLSIARQTVHKWRNYNPLFVANLNAIRQDLWDSQKERIRCLSARALDVLQEDLESENLRLRQAAAVHIWKSGRLYGEGVKPNNEITEMEVHHSWQLQSWRFYPEDGLC